MTQVHLHFKKIDGRPAYVITSTRGRRLGLAKRTISGRWQVVVADSVTRAQRLGLALEDAGLIAAVTA